jgi:hypothetical protein
MRGVLRGVPDLLTELGTTTARLDRTQAPGVGSGGTKVFAPDPINTTTHLIAAELTHLVSSLALHLRLKPSRLVAFDVADELGRLVGKPFIDQYRRQLADVVARATAAIDLPQDRVRLGPCATEGCGADLIAAVDDTWVHCGTCGCEYDVAILRTARKLAALSHLHDKTATAAQAGRIFRTLGVPITERTVRAWADRDTAPIAPTGRNLDGRTVYRLGAIINEWERKHA